MLINHLSLTHYPSEMPYRCETCGYRTSSHKDVIDHYYKIHENGEGLQCPYCLKVKELKVFKNVYNFFNVLFIFNLILKKFVNEKNFV